MFVTLYRLPKIRLFNEIRGVVFKYGGAFSPYLHLHKGDRVLYGGCFMIETVSEIAGAIGKEGRMYVVEADKDSCDRLIFDMRRRYIDNVAVLNLGIWKEKGQMCFETSHISHRNQIRPQSVYSKLTAADFDKIAAVTVDSLDNIVERMKWKELDVVFLTISGAEKEAIMGMQYVLSRLRPHLVIRCALVDKASSRPVYHSVKKQLETFGYKVALGKMNTDRAVRNIYAFPKKCGQQRMVGENN